MRASGEGFMGLIELWEDDGSGRLNLNNRSALNKRGNLICENLLIQYLPKITEFWMENYSTYIAVKTLLFIAEK